MAYAPMFPLWTDAYLGDTRHLSTLEHGAYLLLLITAWRSKDGFLPDDDKMLSKFAGLTIDKWRKIRPTLEPFFAIENGFWMQGRLLDERKADFDFRKSQSKKAKDRHLKNKETTPTTAYAETMPPPTPTPTPIILDSLVSNNKHSRGKNTKIEKPAFVLPSWIDSEVWNQFLEHRKKKKAPMTDYAQKCAVADLQKLIELGNDPTEVINQSIVRGWTGFFEVKKLTNGENFGKSGYYNQPTADDKLRNRVNETARLIDSMFED